MTGHIDGGTFEPAADSITHDTVLVNAEIADRWLKANPRNRPIDEGAVLSYAQQMLDGLWRFDGAPIRFDNTGVLLDGQHRLTAITVAASVTLPILVIRGLEPETQGVMDQGKKRTGGNQLHIAGYKHANSVAAVARQLILIDSGMMFRDSKQQRRHTAVPQIEKYVADHAEVVETINAAQRYIVRIDSRPSIVGAFAVLAAREFNIETVVKFLEDVATLSSLPVGHPAHTLDRRLRNIRKTRESLTDRELIALFIMAFNAYTIAKPIHSFPRPTGGWNVSNFPRIKGGLSS